MASVDLTKHKGYEFQEKKSQNEKTVYFHVKLSWLKDLQNELKQTKQA